MCTVVKHYMNHVILMMNVPFEFCGKDGLCLFGSYAPSDSDGSITMPLVVMPLFFATIAIFTWIFCCIICWCHQKRIKI